MSNNEVKLELHTHSGISKEDMLVAVKNYLDESSGFFFGEEDRDGVGRLVSTAGVITRVDLEGDELTVQVRLLDPTVSFVARTVKALCEANNPPALSPIGYGEQGQMKKVTSVIVKAPKPK